MQTCSRCDATRWYSGNQEVPVDRVLQLVSPVDNLVFEPRPRRQRK